MTSNKFRIGTMVLGAVIMGLLLLVSIFKSTSSTASVGLIFLPVALGIGALLGWLLWFVGAVAVDLKNQKLSLASFRVLAAVFIVITLLSSVSRYQSELGVLKEAQSQDTAIDRFWDLYRQRFVFKDEKIKEALAANPSTPPEVLEQMLIDGRQLYLVGKHPNLPMAGMEKLATGDFSYERMAGIAANPKLPQEFMGKMAKAKIENFPTKTHFSLYQTFVLAALVRRKDIPQTSFDTIASLENPEVFLAYALLGSDKVNCSLAQRLRSYENPGVAAQAEAKGKALGCK